MVLLKDWAGVIVVQSVSRRLLFMSSCIAQASIGGTTGFSDYGATFSHGSRVCLVLDMDAGACCHCSPIRISLYLIVYVLCC